MKTSTPHSRDPLYIIFEQHLYHFEADHRDTSVFIDRVLTDYLYYLRKKNITIPKSLEKPIQDELSTQIQIMLVKKIYGCLTLADYQKKVPHREKKKVKSHYSKLIKKIV